MPRWRRLLRHPSAPPPSGAPAAPPVPRPSGAGAPASGPWPTSPPGPGGQPVSFPLSPVAAPHRRRISHRTLIVLLVAGVALLTGVFAVVALVETPGTPPPCPPLRCEAPPINGEQVTPFGAADAVPGGRLYVFAGGFSLRVYPIPGSSTFPGVSASRSGVTLTYPFIDSLGGDATLSVEGGADQGATPEELVQGDINEIAPNAATRYVLPRAFVGYWSGYGAVYTTQEASSGGPAVTVELIVLAAVHGSRAVTVTAAGRLVGVGPHSKLYNGHPSPAGVSVAYVTGATVNSVTFPGSPTP